MKNSIYFDETFAPVLLVNEESDPNAARNSVWLIFRTSTGANPYLEINVRGTQYTEELDPETSYKYQLAGLYWGAGGATSIRLVAGGVASDYIYITFPEIINTDAALQEVENTDRRYYLQGKTDETTELRSETIKYENGRDYTIGNQMQRIIEFIFASNHAGATALLTATILITARNITTTANVTVTIRVNRVFDEVFVPVQTVQNGKHIITICYPVSNIGQNNRNQVDIYLEIDDGEIEILQKNALATLTASGLAASGGFTGDIEVLDFAQVVTIADAFAVSAVSENVSVIASAPTGVTISESVGSLLVQAIPISNVISDVARVINYEGAKPLMTENLVDYMTTEDGDNLYTEQEHT